MVYVFYLSLDKIDGWNTAHPLYESEETLPVQQNGGKYG